MKTILFLTAIVLNSMFSSSQMDQHTALLLIDIQNFYFPGGKMELVNPGKASQNASRLLKEFRKSGKLIVHIRHNSEPGGEINKIVMPLPEEKIISKNEVNSFLGTGLLEYLRSKSIDTIVICGMQTHMCVEAAVRAGSDLGFKCILIHDACTTRDLQFSDKTVKAEDVHYSTLSTLKSYATVLSTDEFLERFNGH
jgi:nicotinamidase-related amidase